MATTNAPRAKEKKLPLFHKLVVGAAAGVVGTTAIFPLDMVKTRLQSGGSYKGPIDAARTILRNDGIGGFYRGLGANLAGVTPEKAIKLAANESFRDMLEREDGSIALHNEIIAGAAAGACQVVATTPMELVKIRMQMQSTLPKAQQQSTISVVRSLGLRGLYTGATATLIRDVPFSLMFFPGYSNLKLAFADSNGNNSLQSLLLAGGVSGAVSSGLATPLDVVKTRLQLEGGAAKYKGFADCFTRIYQEEGVAALFRGAVPRMCVVAPLFGIALLAFEKQKEYLIKSGRI